MKTLISTMVLIMLIMAGTIGWQFSALQEVEQGLGSTNIGNDYHYTQFSGSIATSTLIQTGVTTLGSVVITEDFAGALTFWDATSTAAVTVGTYATKIAVLQSALTEGTYTFDVSAIRGLVMVSADGFSFAGDLTLTYR